MSTNQPEPDSDLPPTGRSEFAQPSAVHGGNGAPLIDLRGVTKVYGLGSAAMQALRGVDLQIERGEFVAVMGASGSGKSTCMNILGCLDTPTSGLYRFQGVEVGALTRNQRALLRRHYLGFVFQSFNLLKRTSALENVELPLIYRHSSATRRRARGLQALKQVGLTGWEHHTPGELSGGQQQRVAIARAIVSDPIVLLADEPTGNLDRQTAEGVFKLMLALNRSRQTSFVIVTHDPGLAGRADRILTLLDGSFMAKTGSAR